MGLTNHVRSAAQKTGFHLKAIVVEDVFLLETRAEPVVKPVVLRGPQVVGLTNLEEEACMVVAGQVLVGPVVVRAAMVAI